MKCPSFAGFLIVAGLTTLAPAAIASSDLANWQTDSGSVAAMQHADGVRLPANAQLFTTVGGGGLTLRIVTRPGFFEDPMEVPMVEVGESALVFLRNGNAGALKLVQSGVEPVTVPVAWPLNESHAIPEPITLEITRRGTALIITTHGQVLVYEAPPWKPDTPVVLSAGAGHDWLINRIALSHEPLVAAGSAGANHWGDDAGAANAADNDAGVSSGADAPGWGETTGSNAGGAANENYASRHQKPSLELFTPPSVRRGRAQEIRAALSPDATGN